MSHALTVGDNSKNIDIKMLSDTIAKSLKRKHGLHDVTANIKNENVDKNKKEGDPETSETDGIEMVYNGLYIFFFLKKFCVFVYKKCF